jgi:hypothetical protein
LAVNIGAIAAPWAFVPTRTAFEPLEAKVPLGPLVGAEKVTAIPASGVVSGHPLVFATVTASSDAYAVPRRELWGVPPASTSVLGAL